MSGILGLGSSGSVDLDSDLIEELKAVDEEAILDPINEDIEDKQAEIDAVDEVAAKLEELLEAIEVFDLYTSDTNVFDEVTADTSGSSASFDAADTSGLNPGTISVTIDQLAQKDVYQSNLISDTTATMDSGTLTITVGDSSYDFDTTDKTYEELVTEMNYISALDVSLEQVGDSSYRMIVKSTDSGTENAVTITQTGLDLGYEDADNHVVTSQNMLATIDGVDYDLSSNKVTLDSGLIITAVDEGDSSITLERDDSSILEAVANVANIYNELVELVDSYTTYDTDTGDAAVISDGSTLRSIMSDIKGMFYDTYGLDDEENAFIYGISFNSDGEMEVDTSELSEAISNNFDDLQELFVGYAEKKGIGTALTEYLDDLDSLNGVMTTYQDKLDEDLSDLEDDLETETEKIDAKYEAMAEKFAAYTVIITAMENAFASMQLIIDGESSSDD